MKFKKLFAVILSAGIVFSGSHSYASFNENKSSYEDNKYIFENQIESDKKRIMDNERVIYQLQLEKEKSLSTLESHKSKISELNNKISDHKTKFSEDKLATMSNNEKKLSNYELEKLIYEKSFLENEINNLAVTIKYIDPRIEEYVVENNVLKNRISRNENVKSNYNDMSVNNFYFYKNIDFLAIRGLITENEAREFIERIMNSDDVFDNQKIENEADALANNNFSRIKSEALIEVDKLLSTYGRPVEESAYIKQSIKAAYKKSDIVRELEKLERQLSFKPSPASPQYPQLEWERNDRWGGEVVEERPKETEDKKSVEKENEETTSNEAESKFKKRQADYTKRVDTLKNLSSDRKAYYKDLLAKTTDDDTLVDTYIDAVTENSNSSKTEIIQQNVPVRDSKTTETASQTTNTKSSTIDVPEGYVYIKAGSQSRADLEKQRKDLVVAADNSRTTIKAAKLLMDIMPKFSAKNKSKLSKLVNEAQSLLIEADAAIKELDSVLK